MSTACMTNTIWIPIGRSWDTEGEDGMEFVIDGTKMTDRRSAHEEIARAMQFPGYYGNNLDALFDMLSTLEGKAVLKNTACALNALGGYGSSLIKTFCDAAEENRRFTIIFE